MNRRLLGRLERARMALADATGEHPHTCGCELCAAWIATSKVVSAITHPGRWEITVPKTEG